MSSRQAAHQPSRTFPKSRFGKRWSETDDDDLRHLLKHGKSMHEIAELLGRNTDHVQARITELGARHRETNKYQTSLE
jgi:hypothetical protein